MKLDACHVLSHVAPTAHELKALGRRVDLNPTYLANIGRGMVKMGRKGVASLAQVLGAKVELDPDTGDFVFEVSEKRLKELSAEIAQEAAKAKEESRG